jgi:hypothetical protein
MVGPRCQASLDGAKHGGFLMVQGKIDSENISISNFPAIEEASV